MAECEYAHAIAVAWTWGSYCPESQHLENRGAGEHYLNLTRDKTLTAVKFYDEAAAELGRAWENVVSHMLDCRSLDMKVKMNLTTTAQILVAGQVPSTTSTKRTSTSPP
jgi:hypothetical protein